MVIYCAALVVYNKIAFRAFSNQVNYGVQSSAIVECNFEGLFDVQFGVAHLGERLRQPLGLLFHSLDIRFGEATVRGDAMGKVRALQQNPQGLVDCGTFVGGERQFLTFDPPTRSDL